MQTRTAIPLGILACLLAAGVPSLAAAQHEEQQLRSPITIQVGQGHVGDELLYVAFVKDQRYHGSSMFDDERVYPPEESDYEGGWNATQILHLRVESLNTTLDDAGRRHRTVVLRHQDLYPTSLGPPSRDAQGVLRESTPTFMEIRSWFEGTRLFIDLATRELVASQESWGPRSTAYQSPSSDLDTEFFVQHHNHTLRYGETHAPQNGPEPSCSGHTYTQTSSISARGQLNGTPVLGIRTVRIIVPPPPVGIGCSPWRSEKVSWHAHGDPYPSLIETKSQAAPDAPLIESRLQIVNLTRGHTPIPWGEYPAEPNAFASAQRGLDPWNLPISADLPLPFPLTEAIETFENDSQWRAWNASQPHTRIVGLRYAQESSATNDVTWRLVVKGTDGQGYLVGIAKNLTTGHRSVNTTGPVMLDEVWPEKAPRSPVTLGAAAQRWRAAADLPQETVPDFLGWGYSAWRTTTETSLAGGGSRCEMEWLEPYPQDRLLGSYDRTATLSRVDVGTDRPNLCPPDSIVHNPYSVAEVDLETGHLVWLHEGAFEIGAGTPEIQLSLPELQLQGFRFSWVDTFPTTFAALLIAFLAAYAYPAWKYPAAKLALGILGYTKLARPKILDHRTRELLLQALTLEPGLTPTELSKAANVGWGTTIHHLSVLEHHGLVTSIIDRRRRRFYPAGSVSAGDRARIGMLRDERIRRIYEYVAKDPGTIQRDIAKALTLHRTALIRDLKRMEAVGLVTRTPGAGRVHYFARATTPPSA